MASAPAAARAAACASPPAAALPARVLRIRLIGILGVPIETVLDEGEALEAAGLSAVGIGALGPVGVGVDPVSVLLMGTCGFALSLRDAGALLGLGGLPAGVSRLLVGPGRLLVGRLSARRCLLAVRARHLTPSFELALGGSPAGCCRNQGDYDHHSDDDQDYRDRAHLRSFRRGKHLCARSLPGSPSV